MSLFLYLVRQCAKKRVRRKANHLLTFQPTRLSRFSSFASLSRNICSFLQKGGVPAAPSGTSTLLRLSPNHRFHPRPVLSVTDFRRPRLSWLDGRCVQGPVTYSPRHGWCAITSESSFVGSGCRPQSELRHVLGMRPYLHTARFLYMPL